MNYPRQGSEVPPPVCPLKNVCAKWAVALLEERRQVSMHANLVEVPTPADPADTTPVLSEVFEGASTPTKDRFDALLEKDAKLFCGACLLRPPTVT